MSGLIRRRGLVARGITLTYVTAGTQDDGDIDLPAGLSGTDLIIYAEFAANKGSPPAAATPSGFTQWFTMAGGVSRIVVSYKIAEVADSSATITAAMSATLAIAQGYFLYRADANISSIVASTPDTEVTAGNPSSQTILASGQGTPLVGIGSYSDGSLTGTVNPRTMSPAKDGEIDLTVSASFSYLARKLYNSSPANIAVDMDDEGSANMLGSGFLRVT
jgi:hypothetical protein